MKAFACAAATFVLAACATPPSGPNVLVLPGSTKTFDQFRFDDRDCRSYADAQFGGKAAEQSINSPVVSGAAAGTLIGAAAGGLLGGAEGAAVGAGFGMATGAAAGSGPSQAAAYTAQQRYDHAFTQCMYAKGHRVPVTGRFSDAPRNTHQAARTPPPPPPPGQPPAEAPPDYRPK